mmetsp:Transcript_30519/g.59989  ORF Transcript_30519/g.59989 Transcript_30519/m.59989 type:complete len:112 (-) Transcript_30519:809-1144(-)
MQSLHHALFFLPTFLHPSKLFILSIPARGNQKNVYPPYQHGTRFPHPLTHSLTVTHPKDMQQIRLNSSTHQRAYLYGISTESAREREKGTGENEFEQNEQSVDDTTQIYPN